MVSRARRVLKMPRTLSRFSPHMRKSGNTHIDAEHLVVGEHDTAIDDQRSGRR